MIDMSWQWRVNEITSYNCCSVRQLSGAEATANSCVNWCDVDGVWRVKVCRRPTGCMARKASINHFRLLTS